jgi:hypothetical protein
MVSASGMALALGTALASGMALACDSRRSRPCAGCALRYARPLTFVRPTLFWWRAKKKYRRPDDAHICFSSPPVRQSRDRKSLALFFFLFFFQTHIFCDRRLFSLPQKGFSVKGAKFTKR